jgi:hypothetical protein
MGKGESRMATDFQLEILKGGIFQKNAKSHFAGLAFLVPVKTLPTL